MAKVIKDQVVYHKLPGGGNEYLAEVKPFHRYTQNPAEAMKFTQAQARKIWLPLHRESVRQYGYSKFGYGKI